MPRTIWVCLTVWALATILAATSASAAPPGVADKDPADSPPTAKKYTGRPGELTEEQEAAIDKIVERFIQYDIGRNPRDREALLELNKLGPEAIPSLIRGLNRSVADGHSCPVTVIGNKLGRLIETCDDPKVLQFIKDELGAGVTKKTPYDNVIGNLKLKAIYRKRKVDAAIAEAEKTSPGSKVSPGKQQSPGGEKPQ